MYIEFTSEMGLETISCLSCQDFIKRNFLGLECQQEVLPGKQSPGVLFYTQTRKASKWKLYTLQTRQRGEGFLLTEILTTKSFCSLTGDREVQQKRQTSTLWWNCKKGNKRHSLTKRIQEWLDSSTTRTEPWLQTVGWRRSLMTKVETIASSWQVVRFSLVSFIFYQTEGRLGHRVWDPQSSSEKGINVPPSDDQSVTQYWTV